MTRNVTLDVEYTRVTVDEEKRKNHNQTKVSSSSVLIS